MRNEAVPLLITLAILLIASNLFPPVSAIDRPGWVSIDVLSFDGTAITAKIVLNVVGNHQNDEVRIYGEDYPGEASVSIGRIVRQVAYSMDTNITTFQYSQSFSSRANYNVTPTLFGLPEFPFDEHNFSFRIVCNFDANIDTHPTTPSLPNGNYEGLLTYIRASRDNDYTYYFLLKLWHSESFTDSMRLWTWGIVGILIFTTVGLIAGILRRNVSREKIVTAASSLAVFVPVYELALQTYKSPLAMTPSDVFVFVLLVADVIVLVVAVQRKSSSDSRRSMPASSSGKKLHSETRDMMLLGATLVAVILIAWLSRRLGAIQRPELPAHETALRPPRNQLHEIKACSNIHSQTGHMKSALSWEKKNIR
jgi:hypothetical protein